MSDHPAYRVVWSEEDGEYVATVDGVSSLSWIEPDPVGALNGLVRVAMADVDGDGAVAQLRSGDVLVRGVPVRLSVDGSERPDVPDDDDALSLAVPFTVCASAGGPYDDEAFVGGFDCGVMHTEMRLLRTVGAAPAGRLVKPVILDQLDLLAMSNGYTVERGEVDGVSGWVWVVFVPGELCGHGLGSVGG